MILLAKKLIYKQLEIHLLPLLAIRYIKNRNHEQHTSSQFSFFSRMGRKFN